MKKIICVLMLVLAFLACKNEENKDLPVRTDLIGYWKNLGGPLPFFGDTLKIEFEKNTDEYRLIDWHRRKTEIWKQLDNGRLKKVGDVSMSEYLFKVTQNDSLYENYKNLTSLKIIGSTYGLYYKIDL